MARVYLSSESARRELFQARPTRSFQERQSLQINLRIFAVVTAAMSLTAPQAPLPDFTPPTPLFRAVLGNDAAEVRRLLNSGADPNEARFIGASTLVSSLMQQNAEIARLLIDRGVNINAPDPAGTTPLMWAAGFETPDTSVVQELLRRGADVNASNKYNDTALTWAMRRGYTPVVQLL